MRHVGSIASRELRSFFVSPVAYVVLALWALLAATFFLASVIAFDSEVVRLQRFGAVEQLELLNLNDHLIGSFLFSMWFVSMFAFGKTLSGLLALFLVSLTYVSIGGFASSLTRNQLVAFLVTLALLFLVGLMIPQLVVFGLASDAVSGGSDLVEVMRWLGTGDHFERMLTGLVETRDLAYFGVTIAGFLLLTKTAVESVRWR